MRLTLFKSVNSENVVDNTTALPEKRQRLIAIFSRKACRTWNVLRQVLRVRPSFKMKPYKRFKIKSINPKLAGKAELRVDSRNFLRRKQSVGVTRQVRQHLWRTWLNNVSDQDPET